MEIRNRWLLTLVTATLLVGSGVAIFGSPCTELAPPSTSIAAPVSLPELDRRDASSADASSADASSADASAPSPDSSVAMEPPASSPAQPIEEDLSPLERGVIAEMNSLRAHPQEWGSRLAPRLRQFQGSTLHLPGKIPLRTEEGPAAFREAMEALRRTRPLPLLSTSLGLSRAARDHVRDHGPKGLEGHIGTDGSTFDQRMKRHGSPGGTMGENISYGCDDPYEVVEQLVVDDGVPGRGHRKNLLQGAFEAAGVSCGPHARHGTMCVIEYATLFDDAGVQ